MKMADIYRRSRQPLAVLSTTQTPPTQDGRSDKAPVTNDSNTASLPHNYSLEANGSLQPTSPEDRRISAVANDEPDSKRNSAVSTTSTNASGKPQRKAYIGHWQLGKTVGKGGCSRVRAVRHRYTQQYGAVKIIARKTAESTRAQSLANLIEATKGLPLPENGLKPIPYGLEREIALMKLLDHRNIVQLYDVWENRSELYLIMEYVEGGELFHYVETRRGVSEIETVIIFRQIISALLYCHRIDICHRDLKPENILLNPENLHVKLIDFGMAALQAGDIQLSTPCGSPHYAAPEVVSAKKYNGKASDAWSVGVILYVMLTGTTPFNYSPRGDIRALFADICRARYAMPQGLSYEAKDLIRRIFVVDPELRISMDEIWEHPFVHKYDQQLGLDGPHGSKENAIGPVAILEDWTLRREAEIDQEILRNMRTMWHSVPESELKAKLLSYDINQEKLFYAALSKHRDDNLESYAGEYDSMSYSPSDYHHTRPAQPIERTQSQYSIMNDEHLRPSHSFVEPPPSSSVSSYDPYRSSRDPVTGRVNDHASVVVHRNGSINTSRASARTSIRQNKSLRVGMLKHQNRGAYNSNSSLSRSRGSRSSLRRSSMSLSTPWPSSPPIVATRPSDVHRRNVSFTHLRQTSTPSILLSQASTRTTPLTPGPYTSRQSNAFEVPDDSPDFAAEQVLQMRKASVVPTYHRIRPRKSSDTPSQTLRSEIRKHSQELEQACDEAFNRVDSSNTNSPSTGHAASSTPPSSLFMSGSATPELNFSKSAARPLPDVPGDNPATFFARTLKEFRAKLAAYKPPGESDEAKLSEVMKMIDDLVPAQQRMARRLLSAPEALIPDHLGLGLPVISEESRSDVQTPKYRSFTAPANMQKPDDQTIRMVPNSPGGIAPLNIRKRMRETENSARKSVQPHARLARQRSNDASDWLEDIDENEVLSSATPVVKKKKSSWFGLGKVLGGGSTTTQETKRVSAAETNEMSNSGASSEFPMRKKEGKRGFGRLFGKRGAAAKEVAANNTANTAAHSRSMESLFSDSSPSPSINEAASSSGKGRSWFARFLNLKPPQKLLCFSISRKRVRQELIILLREWQNHGIRDIQYDQATQSITARVDRENSLDIKPVAFRIELFVVLEHGRRVGMCISRFTQIKGGPSGFKKVMEVVDGVMRSRGWLVENEDQVKALCEIVERR